MRRGTTLIELIIVIVLFSILAGFISWTFVAGLKVWDSGINRTKAREDASLAMERMVRELGQASLITAAQVDGITFVADVDDDGSNETITFDVSSNNLIRGVGSLSTILASNVQSFDLSYRNLVNKLMALPEDTSGPDERDKIRVIIISLTMNKDDEIITLSSSVYARNQGLGD